MSQYGNAILHDGEYVLSKDGTAYKVNAWLDYLNRVGPDEEEA